MDSKFKLGIIDPIISRDFGIQRSKEILIVSSVIMLAKILMLTGQVLGEAMKGTVDYNTLIARLVSIMLHMLLNYLQYKFPLAIYKYHSTILLTCMLVD